MEGLINGQQQAAEKIWVIGGGRFGLHAVAMLRQRKSEAEITLIEKEVIANPPDHVTTINEDGVAWLSRNLTSHSSAIKIIPALPVHLAAQWLKSVLAEEHMIVQPLELPNDLVGMLPHPNRQTPFQAVVSHADFICPSHCSEPEWRCTYTGKPRPQPLNEYIEAIKYESFKPLVIRSRQFAPGVGGFFPEDLWQLYHQVKSSENTPLLIGTACKCHGIVDGMMVDRFLP